jgi:hypothetical protein
MRANDPATVSAIRVAYSVARTLPLEPCADHIINIHRAWKRGTKGEVVSAIGALEYHLANIPGCWDRWMEVTRARLSID